MQITKKILPLTVMSLAIVALTAGALNAQASWLNKRGEEKPNVKFNAAQMKQMQTAHQAINKAVENNDYAAFQAALAQNAELKNKLPLAGISKPEISQDDFNKMVQVNQLIKDGKYDEAKKLQQESGVKMMFGNGRGMGKMAFKKDFKLEDKNGDRFCTPDEQTPVEN